MTFEGFKIFRVSLKLRGWSGIQGVEKPAALLSPEKGMHRLIV